MMGMSLTQGTLVFQKHPAPPKFTETVHLWTERFLTAVRYCCDKAFVPKGQRPFPTARCPPHLTRSPSGSSHIEDGVELQMSDKLPLTVSSFTPSVPITLLHSSLWWSPSSSLHILSRSEDGDHHFKTYVGMKTVTTIDWSV